MNTLRADGLCPESKTFHRVSISGIFTMMQWPWILADSLRLVALKWTTISFDIGDQELRELLYMDTIHAFEFAAWQIKYLAASAMWSTSGSLYSGAQGRGNVTWAIDQTSFRSIPFITSGSFELHEEGRQSCYSINVSDQDPKRCAMTG